MKNKINPICVKDILKSRQFYSGKNNTSVIDDWELYMYFKEKSIYLIKGDSIIELEPSYLIE
ncbi:hypothetical protein BN863_32530 [Formosa agariphila KMM 3901]|uniref:Uncharacterized protein n=1 Tax=Formosa agariphila (strain DSM 15362 / KCTC 12365 / LMG 23005 / KMM 3901 / M-2Alg 35-1) TaxID=1347342 RepID=T2KQF7_FORAG|nr:hypothetical protein BN863_32530 [Formosa agariphila KMM 3901]